MATGQASDRPEINFLVDICDLWMQPQLLKVGPDGFLRFNRHGAHPSPHGPSIFSLFADNEITIFNGNDKSHKAPILE